MSDPAQDIFRSLVAERSGISTFDETQKIVALRLAEMLASDAAVSAPAIVALIGLLPPKASDNETPLDYSRLTDKEFHILDKLVAKAANRALPPAPFEEPKLRRRSPRQRQAEELAVLCDQLEAEADAQRKVDWRQPWRASGDDIAAVRNAITSLLGLTVMWRDLAEPEISAVYDVRREVDDREAANAPAVSAVAAGADAPAGAAIDPANVIKPPIAAWGVITGPRDMGPQRSVAHHIRSDLPPGAA